MKSHENLFFRLGLLFSIAAAEFINAAGRVNQFHFAGIERVRS